jgi:hypothetical protein
VQKAEVVVEARGKVNVLPWHQGLTLGAMLELAVWSPALTASEKSKPMRLIHDGRSGNIEVKDSARALKINPGDKIVIPE